MPLNRRSSVSQPFLQHIHIEDVSVDGLRFPPTEGDGASIAMNNVRRHEIRDAGAPLVNARCSALSAAEAPAEGKPYAATATVVNGAAAGLGKVELQTGEQNLIRWVWLKPNETRKVVFDGVMAASGSQELRCGTIRKQVPVRQQ